MDLVDSFYPGLQIEYLGHAGFMIETKDEVILMDPWLSKSGAYASSWFQYPCNHHLAWKVLDKIETTTKEVIVYISHEHQDHFDEAFLAQLPEEKVRLLMPEFARDFLYKKFHSWKGGAHFFRDGGAYALKNGYLEFYIHDSVREADSAVLMNYMGFKFLNMNDCHIHDRVLDIKNEHGHIDIMTGHFSGASWFPVCYDYDVKEMRQKCARNKYARFNTLMTLIEEVQPGRYVPSAGPACFLDPDLFELNFLEESIFPDIYEFYKFWTLTKYHVKNVEFHACEPGDNVLRLSAHRPYSTSPEQRRKELLDYQLSMKDCFESPMFKITDWPDSANYLMQDLEEKLNNFSLSEDLDLLLWFRSEDAKEKSILVDFQHRKVSFTPYVQSSKEYVITACYKSWLTKAMGSHASRTKLSWYEWLLSLRFLISRNPDEFNVLLDGFLVNEAEDLPAFCTHYEERQSSEKIEVTANNKKYRICRRCPHEGADLSNAIIEGDNLVCPKHNWKFDLENGGKCDVHDSTIQAELLDG